MDVFIFKSYICCCWLSCWPPVDRSVTLMLWSAPMHTTNISSSAVKQERITLTWEWLVKRLAQIVGVDKLWVVWEHASCRHFWITHIYWLRSPHHIVHRRVLPVLKIELVLNWSVLLLKLGLMVRQIALHQVGIELRCLLVRGLTHCSLTMI